jgi:YidC/Oxa1 family membrane protein insertase
VDWQRNVLLAAIFAVFAVLFVRWNEFSEARQPKHITAMNEAVYVPDGSVPSVMTTPSADANNAVPAGPAKTNSGERLIHVKTDVLDLVIDTRGGDIVRAALPEYPTELRKGSPPFLMLNRTRDQIYVAQSGLIGPNGTDRAEDRPQFLTDQTDYSLNGVGELRVPLHYRQGDILITKEFVFRSGNYLIDVRYSINNKGVSPWSGRMFGQIQRDRYNPVLSSAFGMKPYLGAALSTAEENYKKVGFDALDKKPFDTERTGGWVAMVQHYFVSAWIPDQTTNNHYKLRRLGGDNLYAFGFVGPEYAVQPGQNESFGAGFYVGPKNQEHLGEIAPYLDLTIDYGWLWWLAKPLFAGLHWLHNWLGNWGWAIIVVTVLLKLVFFPLSAASYRSMARMRKLQPEMQNLRERYGADRQQLSQEVMALYKREKVNPMGGCLPMLIQMPVFIALYWVLSESIELRHAPWILWISDLSVRDPLYVLPILNGLSMFVLQTLQPAPPDPTQAKVMKVMPVLFSFFFVFFPAGLVLYWTVNSVLSIAQQWAITRRIIAE